YLGVRVGAKPMPLGQEALLEAQVVVDGAVVDGHEGAGAVGGGMSVLLGRGSVRRPSGMAEPHAARQWVGPHERFEAADLAGMAPDLQPVPVEYRQPRRVVASVLEPLKAVQNDLSRAPVSDISDDSAHSSALSIGKSETEGPGAHGGRSGPGGARGGRCVIEAALCRLALALAVEQPPPYENSNAHQADTDERQHPGLGHHAHGARWAPALVLPDLCHALG